jgi:hypothetical protein
MNIAVIFGPKIIDDFIKFLSRKLFYFLIGIFIFLYLSFLSMPVLALSSLQGCAQDPACVNNVLGAFNNGIGIVNGVRELFKDPDSGNNITYNTDNYNNAVAVQYCNVNKKGQVSTVSNFTFNHIADRFGNGSATCYTRNFSFSLQTFTDSCSWYTSNFGVGASGAAPFLGVSVNGSQFVASCGNASVSAACTRGVCMTWPEVVANNFDSDAINYINNLPPSQKSDFISNFIQNNTTSSPHTFNPNIDINNDGSPDIECGSFDFLTVDGIQNDYKCTDSGSNWRPSSEFNINPSPTPTPTESPTPSPTPTPTESPTPSPTPTPTESPTPSPTPTPTESPTPSPTPTPTESPTPSPTPTPTESPTPSPTPTDSDLVLPDPPDLNYDNEEEEEEEDQCVDCPQDQFSNENFFSYALDQFSNKFPFDALGSPPVSPGIVCPLLNIYNRQFELCFINQTISGLKFPVWIIWLLKLILH